MLIYLKLGQRGVGESIRPQSRHGLLECGILALREAARPVHLISDA